MTEKEFLEKFLVFCKEYGYASAWPQTDCIDSFLKSLESDYSISILARKEFEDKEYD